MTGGRRAPDADLIVIGGGIVGLSTALEMQRRGRRVAIADPDMALGRASFGNAGVISRGSVFPVAGPGLLAKVPGYLAGRDVAVRIRPGALVRNLPWAIRFAAACTAAARIRAAAALDPLLARSLAHHEALARWLGTEHLIHPTGYMRVHRTAPDAASLERERAVLGGMEIATDLLGADDIATLEPHLARRYACGLIATQSASVQTPGALVARMARAFRDGGGEWIAGMVHELRPGPDAVEIRLGAEIRHAAQVVVAAGARSAALARQAGDRIPLGAERGYHREMALAGNATLARPVHDAEGGFVMAPMEGRVRVTSGVEFARPDDPPDPRQIEAVVADAGRSLPFAAEGAGEVWMGSRPSTPDGLPVIGRSRRTPRVVYAFGHGHIGFGTGPVTGAVVADLIDGRAPAVPVASFSAGRF